MEVVVIWSSERRPLLISTIRTVLSAYLCVIISALVLLRAKLQRCPYTCGCQGLPVDRCKLATPSTVDAAPSM
ncbi:hypothetical protein Hypma_012698 [Hypsizygus marmoreus]|uniref:Uncharacterized protein n=1 Tax=Hypsizygus marmoreus TaxID=39966 RepID=A0A369JGC1_HYPMA|nr:hypothetical protein Hypma_012698 [Hypsizygus marmoreus]